MLSPEGKKYKRETTAHIVQNYPSALLFFKPNKPYLVLLRFFFEDVENSGYGKGKAASRYKIFDGGNRTKLVEDALKDAGGIDDSQTLTSIWQKVRGAPKTIIWAWCTEEENTPFDDALRSLY